MDNVSWCAIGASAELLAAVGVLATLVFFAMQVRQTGKILERNLMAGQASAVSSRNAAMRNFRIQLAIDEASHSIWSTGLVDPKQLSEIEVQGFAMLFQCRWKHLADVYSQTVAWGLAPEVLQTQGRERVQLPMCTLGGNYCWEQTKSGFPEAFRKAGEAELSAFQDAVASNV